MNLENSRNTKLIFTNHKVDWNRLAEELLELERRENDNKTMGYLQLDKESDRRRKDS